MRSALRPIQLPGDLLQGLVHDLCVASLLAAPPLPREALVVQQIDKIFRGDGAGVALVDKIEELLELSVAELLRRELGVAAHGPLELCKLDRSRVVAVILPEELVPVLPPAVVRAGAKVLPHKAEPRQLVTVQEIVHRDATVTVEVHGLQDQLDAR